MFDFCLNLSYNKLKSDVIKDRQDDWHDRSSCYVSNLQIENLTTNTITNNRPERRKNNEACIELPFVCMPDDVLRGVQRGKHGAFFNRKRPHAV